MGFYKRETKSKTDVGVIGNDYIDVLPSFYTANLYPESTEIRKETYEI